MGKRNYYVELCRFVGSIIILCHHSYIFVDRKYFIGGWLFVEFFFLLTGYYTTKHFSELSARTTSFKSSVVYVKNKILKLLPFAYLGIALGFIKYLMQDHTAHEKLLAVLSLPFNFLFLSACAPIQQLVCFDAPLWYVSVIVLFLAPIIFVMNRWPRFYKYFLCLFLAVLISSYNYITYGSLAVWAVGFPRLFRGVADLLLGSMLFYLCEYLRKVFNGRFQLMINSLSVVMFIAFAGITIFGGGGEGAISCLMLGFTLVLVALLMLNDMHTSSEKLYKLSMHLGSLSIPVYCLHYPIEELIQLFFSEYSYDAKLFAAIIVSIGISEILLLLLRKRNSAMIRR